MSDAPPPDAPPPDAGGTDAHGAHVRPSDGHDTSDAPRPSSPAARPPRTDPARRGSLIAAAAVVVLTVGAVVLWGVERPPELSPLEPGGGFAPEAGIAWTDGDDTGSCVHLARPDGSSSELTCEVRGRVVGWDDRGVLVQEFVPDGTDLVIVDPDTGDRQTEALDEPIQRGAGDEVVGRHLDDGDVLRIEDRRSSDVQVANLAAGPSYDLRWGEYAPDRHGVAVIDSADRLLFIPVDDRGHGVDAPRVWVEDVEAFDAVWQGRAPEDT